MRKEKGFTLLELVIVMGIFVFVLISMFRLYLSISQLSEANANQTNAIAEAQTKIEEIRNHTYGDILTDYASGGSIGPTFTPQLLPQSIGIVYVSSAFNSSGEILQIKTVICWEDRSGRIYGEDLNLNGTLDSGEDTNGNGEIDSPVILTTLITRR